MSVPPVKGFTHVSLSVGNLDASLGFYRDLLGLAELVGPFEGTAFEGREAMVAAGRIALCLQDHRHGTREVFNPLHPGLDHISLAVESISALTEFADHLTMAGVNHSGVKPLRGYGRFIELRDPDGILVELHCVAT